MVGKAWWQEAEATAHATSAIRTWKERNISELAFSVLFTLGYQSMAEWHPHLLCAFLLQSDLSGNILTDTRRDVFSRWFCVQCVQVVNGNEPSYWGSGERVSWCIKWVNIPYPLSFDSVLQRLNSILTITTRSRTCYMYIVALLKHQPLSSSHTERGQANHW